MRMRTVTAAICALGAVVAATVSTGAPATARTSTDLRVGTFNIVTVSADPGASGDRHVWKERRGTIIGQILGQGLDVVGIQEANQSTLYKSRLVGGSTQFLDLRNGLNAAGGHYALTSTASYNCLRAWSSNHCKYRNRAASGDNRILYNHDKLALIYKGAYRYPHQVPGKTARYLAWTFLRDRATGKEFLFTTTHLDPYSIPVRVQQWHDMIAKVNKLKGSRPVIVTGDFNTSKYSPYANTMLPAMQNNGYGDTLGQRYKTNPTALRAQSTRHAWVNSYNGFRRAVGGYGDDRSASTPRTGNGIDWIFATNSLPVREFEVVAAVDEGSMQLTGTIPSDHNMMRATITLP